MPYTIKKFNGQTLTVIQDGTVDTTSTDLQLPGRNYAGYGSALNQSLTYLLENFANSVSPPNKITGQLWFDTSVKKIKVYNGIDFKALGSIEHGSTAPVNQLIGDMWFNTTTNQLFVYDGSAHKLIGPNLTNPSAAQLLNKKLFDNGGNPRTVLQAVFGNDTMAVFSSEAFSLSGSSTPITGYSYIYKGITLPSRASYPNVGLAGVAKTSESLLVNNIEIPAASFLQNTGSSQPMTTDLKIRVEPNINSTTGAFTSLRGLFLGASDSLYLGYNSGVGYISNLSGNALTLSVTNNGTAVKVITAENSTVYPNNDSLVDFGTTLKKWKAVYATNFYAIDNPNLAANNAAFRGRVEGTTVNASVGFFGNLTGNVKGNVLTVGGTVVLATDGTTPIYTGRVNAQTGGLFGNIINSNAVSGQQTAVDTSAATTVFRGRLEGTADYSLTLRVGSDNRSAYIGTGASTQTDYRNTIPVRDSDGRIRAVGFDGVASSAQFILDENNIPRPGSVASAGYTVVIRESDGSIRVSNITGTADKAVRLVFGEGSVVPDDERTPGTVAVRTAAGNLKANTFEGTATSAQYADLAEKYLPDAEYEVGTVVMIGGEKEVTACAWGKRAIGVVSANPAFMMNKDLEGGVYIALKGRVPVKVIGRVKKGEDLIATNNGMAMMSVPHASGVFAVALETSDDEGPKVIEALIL
jgi:hypothetical protein